MTYLFLPILQLKVLDHILLRNSLKTVINIRYIRNKVKLTLLSTGGTVRVTHKFYNNRDVIYVLRNPQLYENNNNNRNPLGNITNSVLQKR